MVAFATFFFNALVCVASAASLTRLQSCMCVKLIYFCFPKYPTSGCNYGCIWITVFSRSPKCTYNFSYILQQLHETGNFISLTYTRIVMCILAVFQILFFILLICCPLPRILYKMQGWLYYFILFRIFNLDRQLSVAG